MKNITIRIGQKIIGGFIILIVIFTLNTLLIFITLNQSASSIQESSEVINPSREGLNELNLMVTKSKMYITNWVFLQSNTEDKEALKRLHDTEYPELKEKLKTVMASWKQKDQIVKMDSVLSTFEELLKVEKGIMDKLVTFENYEDPEIKFEASNAIDSEVLPKSALLISKVNDLLKQKRSETQKAEANLVASFDSLRFTTVSVGLTLIVIGLIAAFFISRSIIRPIDFIKKTIIQLGRGELPQESKQSFNRDEVGEMAEAVDKLVVGLRSTSLFAESIGKGSYDAEFAQLSDNDVLGNALINMRNNLQQVAEDDKKRSWSTEGMAIFGEILRKNNDNIARLTDEIISNLVKYLKANQGGLFIINDESAQEEPHLYLSACYAWDKKKYLEQKIYIGDGLTGQVWQEKEAIYLTEVPNNYISITSGLGEANPRSILIMPLKINNQVYGVLEIASFNELLPYEQEFVERIAESIASTISTVKINERTQKLLNESNQMTEEMRAQEEEMRQNMEELQATQEEMQRAQRDAEAREAAFYNTQCILETDTKFHISHITTLLQTRLQYTHNDLLGSSVAKIFDNRDQFEQLKKSLEQNENWSGVVHLKNKQGEKLLYKIAISAVEDNFQKTSKYLLVCNDLSELQLNPAS
ncbi:MAG: GAF domain-containing protein [Bacteroidota bacterium]